MIYIFSNKPTVLCENFFSFYKIKFLFFLYYPLLFISFLSSEWLIPISSYAILIGTIGFFNNNSYYFAPIIPLVFISFIYGLMHIKKKYPIINLKKLLILIVALNIILIFSNNIIGGSNFSINPLAKCPKTKIMHRFIDIRFDNTSNIFDKKIYTIENIDQNAWKILKIIPADSSVTCTGDLLPALSNRRYLYEFALNHEKALEGNYAYEKDLNYNYYNSDYIMLNKTYLRNMISCGYAYLPEIYFDQEIAKLLSKHNYQLITANNGYFLLKK